MQDKRFMNRFWDVCKKVPGLTLYGNVMWFADQFLLVHVSSATQLIDKRTIQSMAPGEELKAAEAGFLVTSLQLQIAKQQLCVTAGTFY
jgi:hypothetical protein